ncbi:hypothetical protein [Paenibacillus sp. FSL R5-0765]|uniref:hypothetical protein n=1 Tax=Paenibacillus sp. FSL R5-0765 TaxID=1920425 RepID=UPI00117FBA18|nr:hypothetical protein [Paenibacillus sp. FSL R5-0765]
MKIDNITQVAVVVTANWSVVYNINLRRNGVLINQLTLARSASPAGTVRFLSSNTYVDTAPVTTTNAYTVSVQFTTSSNVTSASAEVRNINAIRFS